ncbi:MAG: MAPEG family protein [Novosphingobium sp.]
MPFTTTLSLAAAALLINIWLSIRCGSLRGKLKILHGDGGNAALMQRMRAHSNFIENTPLVLIAIGLVEASGKGGQWLAIMGGVFMLGRVAHGIGMDNAAFNPFRGFGVIVTMLTQLALIVIGVLIVLGKF